MTSAPATLSAPEGDQRPRIFVAPTYATSHGQDAIELARIVGLQLDEWQQFVLQHSLGCTPDGKWAANEIGVVVPRQNGKGSLLEARELAGLFLFGERRIIHTAHEFKTASDGFKRIWQWIQDTPELDREVDKVSTSHGSEGILLTSGAELRFLARSSGSGRGFGCDTLILDESFKLDGRAISALLPTMAARPNWQVWYTSSAPLPDSEALHALRARGLEAAGVAA